MNRIISILPKGEGFSPQSFGAIALCVRDFTQHSRYQAQTSVIGGVAGTGFDGIRYIPISRARWWENRTRGYARQCAEVIKQEQAALIEVHNRPQILRLIAPKITCRMALHLHNDPQSMKALNTPKKRHTFLACCDGVYCVSNYIRGRFLEGLEEAAQAKLHLVYNGIAIPAAVQPKENLIVFAGRMTEDKGALPLAQALRTALPKLPGWRAVLMGGRRHAVSETLSSYEQQIAETLKPVSAQATLAGFLSYEETLQYFSRAAIAVVPSVWEEPFGRTALEALAYGCAVISSGRGGLREVTEDAALSVSDLTPEKLTDALLTLANNAAKRQLLQREARTRAACFSIAKCTETLDDVRDTILKESNQHAA